MALVEDPDSLHTSRQHMAPSTVWLLFFHPTRLTWSTVKNWVIGFYPCVNQMDHSLCTTAVKWMFVEPIVPSLSHQSLAFSNRDRKFLMTAQLSGSPSARSLLWWYSVILYMSSFGRLSGIDGVRFRIYHGFRFTLKQAHPLLYKLPQNSCLLWFDTALYRLIHD